MLLGKAGPRTGQKSKANGRFEGQLKRSTTFGIELLRWRMRYMGTFEGMKANKVSSSGSCMAG